ncbi:endonuclease/exonuclease/phosphatase family protein [Cobetia sp. L2A1]|uniref:endonuclease/exonuclease/phosphatase family protein n=1 Tax=Cobetia sp. L2A1 TaxID=2686360 RepID=UPI00131E7B0E
MALAANPVAASSVEDAVSNDTASPLRILTFNMQVGIHTAAWHHYVTRGWQHLLPHPKRRRRLELIAGAITPYDIVGLQEVDGGSFRSGNVNQVDSLADTAEFPYHYQQLNRNLGRLAQHSNGLLSRLPISHLEEHRLPGTLPGRGAIHARFGDGEHALHVFVTHLALGARIQRRQLDYLGELIAPLKNVIVMGDLNCTLAQLRLHKDFCEALDSRPSKAINSYPAWQPSRGLDHILVSSTLRLSHPGTLSHLFSDHLPMAVEVHLPAPCRKAIGLI